MKKSQKNLITYKEKSPETNLKSINSNPNRNDPVKKSQSNAKENKPLIATIVKDSFEKLKTQPVSPEEDKIYLQKSDSDKTPKKNQTNPLFSNFLSPMKIIKSISNRSPLFAESDKSKLFSFLNSNSVPISINNLKLFNSIFQTAKYSSKSLAYVKAYSANTNQGIVR